jgi:hypothetical protein
VQISGVRKWKRRLIRHPPSIALKARRYEFAANNECYQWGKPCGSRSSFGGW